MSALEAVRRRPAMYIGDTRDGSGMHYMLWRVVEGIGGRARRVRVSVEGQLAEVLYMTSHQREHVEAIEQAKKPETRERRIQAAVKMVLSK